MNRKVERQSYDNESKKELMRIRGHILLPVPMNYLDK